MEGKCYLIQYQGKNAWYAHLDDALAVARRIYEQTGLIVGISTVCKAKTSRG